METETIIKLSAIEPPHEHDLLDRAKQWAALHSNPKTRSKMDERLVGLSEGDQRKVHLDGQRISGGMPPKHWKDNNERIK
jgi:hypothetical protein